MLAVQRPERPVEGGKLRIAYLTQWFEPEPNIIKGIEFVRALEAAGHEVTVVTGFPNYPEGRIYPGYRQRLVQRETIGGVRIIRLPLYPSHDRSSIRRSLNYLSFFLSCLVYLIFRRSKFDLAYVYHPPITVGLAAAVASLLRPLPFVLDIQDLWPETIAATGMSGADRLMAPLGACCTFVYRGASAIIAQSEGMKRALLERGVPDEKIDVVRNWADAEFRDIPPVKRSNTRFTLVYGGNLGRAQQLDSLLDAAAHLQERPDIVIQLFGSGVDEPALRQQARERGLSNVRFRGRIPQQEMMAVFASADGLLLSLGDDPLFGITIPSKTQFYLAMGRPIVAAVNGEAADMLHASGAALVVPPRSPRELAEAIRELAEMSAEERVQMGARGAEYYRRNLSFARGKDRTISLLEGTHRKVTAGLRNR